ncbi:LacI family DNA-binding transcriptional regulator [Glycomyces sp. NPDC048151]|uniref:LacI family DNA-binding transcriptional regulator n=1 Tax=Glycomyces sp. NPDC048151 TaxID=3364002 RepID=UPI003711A834
MAMQQRATAEDVARLARVSSKTVSRVFGNREAVAPATAERVLDAAKRLRFRPNSLARTLRRGGATDTVGFVMGEFGNPFYYGIASGIEQELSRNGNALVVATTGDVPDGEERVVDALLAQRVGALLLVPVAADQSYLEGERHLGTPVVAIDRPARNLVADAIVLAGRDGVRDATTRLLRLGHRRIGYACNPASVATQAERVAGYREAMAANGIGDTRRWERLVDDPHAAPERIIAGLLGGEDPPTAVVTGNNRMTVGALRAMRSLGGDAPALIGFDDFDTADVLGVSVIAHDPVDLGRHAARLAIERMADPLGFTRRIELPTRFVARGSGERPPARAGGPRG